MRSESQLKKVPVIDIAPFLNGADKSRVATAIGEACRECGFFYIVGHGIDPRLQRDLVACSREFFKKPEKEKLKIAMALGGKAWRGYFPVGGELTSGKADLKEGIYFGAELPSNHPKVKAGIPLHGANLFPNDPKELRSVVLRYLTEMTRLSHSLMAMISMSLGLPESYFRDHYTNDPLILFRIFNYPPSEKKPTWGVGEHTDYGVLTVLRQDETAGLEVKTKSGWILAEPVPDSFICNIGDMLDRMTKGLYRSTLHRVRNESKRDRLSFPFFFDPNFDADVKPLPIAHSTSDDKDARWDSASVHEFEGTYGDYLLQKVSRVFPELAPKLRD